MNDVEFLVCDIALLWRRVFNLQTKHLDISNIERRIIINVARNPGATQVEMSQITDVDPQNLIRPLDKLIANGWLEKRPDPNDRRIRRLFTTKKCQPILAKINAIGDTVRPAILKDMSAAEIKRFNEQLLIMKTNLEQYLAEL